ncbi:MAG: hypothetical protein JRN13_06670 [Nitrososphaerota archaeon]|nr:hypothetical protein [Nitrososphaerota archaeon]MDG6974127.1 hypothetical protein [Nitrososphaerota archaeon]MDG6987293.1 hypothetical protein [Nitrososphaerota archaeon]MDG7015423.1 hypothetical protein [Nitrososphaerota archaeon]WGO50167.1 MAG: hypothetical protein JRM93_04880 [Nitrososphaerota archaeon]
MANPRKLPTFKYQEKVWAVDEKLGEFRHIVFGEMPEFVAFGRPQGFELLKALSESRE